MRSITQKSRAGNKPVEINMQEQLLLANRKDPGTGLSSHGVRVSVRGLLTNSQLWASAGDSPQTPTAQPPAGMTQTQPCSSCSWDAWKIENPENNQLKETKNTLELFAQTSSRIRQFRAERYFYRAGETLNRILTLSSRCTELPRHLGPVRPDVRTTGAQ